MLMLPAIVTALLLASACAPKSTSPAAKQQATTQPQQLPKTVTVPLYSRGEHVFAHANLDSANAGFFMIDTGAALDAVGLGLAGRLKLPHVGEGTAIGIGGPEKFTYRKVNQLSIGRLELPTQRLAAINLNRFSRQMGITVNGVIGFPSLGRVPFTIDYRVPSLTVYPQGVFEQPIDAVAQPMRLSRGLPMVLAEIEGAPSVWLLVDTGADRELMLPLAYLQYWPDCVGIPVSGDGQSTGVGGKVRNLQTWLKQVNLFGMEMKHVPVNFERSQSPQSSKRELVGRIGHRLLENFRLTFDSRRRVIWAQWQPAAHNQLAERAIRQTSSTSNEADAPMSVQGLPK
jgi:hypothetical protein